MYEELIETLRKARIKTGQVFAFPEVDPAENAYLERVQMRLTAYEATGLEPDDIESLKIIPATNELLAYRAIGTVDELSALVKARDEGPMAGDCVYVLERDECGEAIDISGFMFLAVVGQGAIVSPYIDEIEDLESTVEYHIRETAENMSTDLYVYPIEDMYLTRAEAEAALSGGGENA